MARERHVMILALVMLAMIGFASAADAPKPSEDDYEDDDDSEFLIGTRKGDPPLPGGIVAAPIGGPVPPGASILLLHQVAMPLPSTYPRLQEQLPPLLSLASYTSDR